MHTYQPKGLGAMELDSIGYYCKILLDREIEKEEWFVYVCV